MGKVCDSLPSFVVHPHSVHVVVCHDEELVHDGVELVVVGDGHGRAVDLADLGAASRVEQLNLNGNNSNNIWKPSKLRKKVCRIIFMALLILIKNKLAYYQSDTKYVKNILKDYQIDI